MGKINSYKSRRPKLPVNTGSPSLNSVLNFQTLKEKVVKSLNASSVTLKNTSKKKMPVYRFGNYGGSTFYL